MIQTRRAPDYADMPLHEILQLDEGPQTEALHQLHADRRPSREMIRLRTKSGRRMDVMLGGEKFTIMPKGRSVSKRVAIRLLREYGYRGKYHRRHRPTGLRREDLMKLPEETKLRLKYADPSLDFDNLNFIDDYLYHDTEYDPNEDYEVFDDEEDTNTLITNQD